MRSVPGIKKSLASIAMIGVLILAGCKKVVYEHSSAQTISGIVVKKLYEEAYYLNPSDNLNPMRDIDPLFDLKKSRYATKIPEQHIVFYDTAIGEFRINNKELFERVEPKSPVEMTYREVFRSTYDDTDGDGKKDDLVEKVSLGYQILDVK